MAVSFVVNGTYSGDTVGAAFLSACQGGTSGAAASAVSYHYGPGYSIVSCFAPTGAWLLDLRDPVVTVSGASSSTGSSSSLESEQIAAINELYPEAAVILGIAWAFRYVRTLIEVWVSEQGRGDAS